MIFLVVCDGCGSVLNGIARMTDDDFLETLAAAVARPLDEQDAHLRNFAAARRSEHAPRCPATV